ncbi:MAG: hypothetical protein OQK09_01600 [Colwellia sp.]|nr:hypothetical protein [Colwellia sp.]MCW9080182.1 hypothetical protein [Colwellia sp.]
MSNSMINSFKAQFIYFLILLSCTTLISSTANAKNSAILIYIQDDVYLDYKNFVGERDVLTIKNFSGKTIRRDVVDMIIAQQALQLGGFPYDFSYAPGKVNFRNTKMLQNGDLLISFDSYWKRDAEALADKLYISAPVIRNGEYVAGIYTSPNNQKVLQIKKLTDFTKLTAISTPKWRTDWQTLQDLSLKELVKENSWLSMVRMVNLQWVDFMLMPFNSTADQSFTLEKIHLIPVPNMAIVLKDSRHFVISKAHPQGEAAFIAINKGLKILREYGTITKAYTEAGFFVDPVKYKILNQ